MVDITLGKPEEIVDTVSAPAHASTWDCPADGRVVFTYTPEITAGKNVNLYIRFADWNDLVAIITGWGDGQLTLQYNDGSWHNIESHTGVFTDGVSAEIEVIYSGTSIIVNVDGVEKINNTCAYNTSVAGGAWALSLVTNDIEATSYTLSGGTPEILLAAGGVFSVGKTYYMRADGTAANKEAATSDAAASTSMNVAVHDASSFSPGDSIIVSDAGGDYRSILYPKSGDASGDVTYVASGSPVFNASALLTGWTNHAGNVWKATLASQPNQVWIDETFGDRKASLVGVVNNYDWFWDDPTNTLYLYDSSGDPDNRFAPGVEVGSLGNCCITNDLSYITFDGLTFAKSLNYGVWSNGSSHLTFRNCVFEWQWMSGCIFNSSGTQTSFSHITIEDCVARYNAVDGINFTLSHTASSDHLVRRNTVYSNGRYQYADPKWEYMHEWPGGIKFVGVSVRRCVVEQNVVYDNGPSPVVGTRGSGIWFDYADAASGHENHIRHNLIYNCRGVALYNEVSSYNWWYGNVCYDNGQGADYGVWSACSVRVDARSGSHARYNKFYNNTVVGGLFGILILRTDSTGNPQVSYNEFRNNIVVGTVDSALYADDGGDNDGVGGTGNVYNANCFGAESNNFISWGGVDYDTYDAWIAASSQTDNNVEADPLLANVGSDQYWLQDGSPCIDAGVNLGSPYNLGLQQSSTWPDGVATAEQGIFGSGWEIGAYIYPPTGGAVGDDTRHSRWFHLLTRRGHG